MPVIEEEVAPLGYYRFPGAGRDGVLRRRGRALARAIHHGDECAIVHAWTAGGRVRLRAEAPSADAAAHAVERMRFALCLDHDLRPFHQHFRTDRLLGPVIRRMPWIRPHRIADPFQALAWAVTEQLIETERAWAIQRRLAWRYGRRSPCGTFVDSPSAGTLAGRAPAELQACDLSAGRSRALVRAAREVAAGRADLTGPWTLQKLAVHGQGRDDQLPAGDLAYIKLAGRLAGLGRRATVDEVREFFAPYAPFAALAGIYLLAGRNRFVNAPPGVAAFNSPARRMNAVNAAQAAGSR